MALWRIIRLDDNGHRYVMAERDSKEEAQRMVDDFTARGHKQAYWVERVAEEEPGTNGQEGFRDE